MKIAPLLLAAAAFRSVAIAQGSDWGNPGDDGPLSDEYQASKALCRSLKDREPPAADRPTAAQRRALQGCDSEALYYGIGIPADPQKARLCAFIEAESEQTDGPFAGRSMLMTIYANGRGARRDLDVATHLACAASWAPAEAHGRVTHLREMKAAASPGSDFDYCDDVTSGYAGGFCAAHAARIAGARRDAEVAALSRGWSTAERAALARLRAATSAFAEARAEGEVDARGTGRAAFETEASEAVEEELLEVLKSLSAGTAPKASAAAFRLADAKLNAAYRTALRSTEPSDMPGAVTREGIRDAQRAWLRYRDAFLAFAAVKFPSVSRDSLAAWLSERRTKMLLGAELP